MAEMTLEHVGKDFLGTVAVDVEAMTLGERVAVMRDGRIVQAAEPLQLYRELARA